MLKLLAKSKKDCVMMYKAQVISMLVEHQHRYLIQVFKTSSSLVVTNSPNNTLTT